MVACVHDSQHGCCASAGPSFGWVLHGSLTLPDHTKEQGEEKEEDEEEEKEEEEKTIVGVSLKNEII